MAVTHRPRNIRDIAHLYLSRRVIHTPASSLNIFLTASSKDCFSGFHTANLAAAFSKQKACVRVFELSGLLPNAAFYFSHSPHVYLGWEKVSPREFAPALNAISVAFDPVRLMSEFPQDRGLRVNLIHLPPAGVDGQSAVFLKRVVGRCARERWAIYLTPDGSVCDPDVLRWLGSRATFSLTVDNGSGSTRPPAVATGSLGSISRWRMALKDRVPVVFRNPNTGLSRQYMAISESILCQINSLRRNSKIERLGATRAGAARQ